MQQPSHDLGDLCQQQNMGTLRELNVSLEKIYKGISPDGLAAALDCASVLAHWIIKLLQVSH